MTYEVLYSELSIRVVGRNGLHRLHELRKIDFLLLRAIVSQQQLARCVSHPPTGAHAAWHTEIVLEMPSA